MRPRFTRPLEPADFLARFWQKAPLFMPAAAAGLQHPDPDTLAGLALEEGVESRIITGSGAGPWNSQHGPFSPDDFASMPRANWTLLVQSVDHFLTEVSLLLDDFRFLPSWRIEDIMISYAARGGSVGPHFDRYDVFLVQARGERRWQLGPLCDETTPLMPHDSLRLLENMPVENEYLARPGDVLYLPPGVAHYGIAQDDDCVTWSVGLRAPSPLEVLERLVDAVGESDDHQGLFRDAGRRPATESASLSREDQQALVHQGLAAITEDQQRIALASLLSEPRQPDGLDFEVDCGHIAAALPNAVLVRHGATRLILDDLGDAWLNGECWPLDDESRPLVSLLASKRFYEADELGVFDRPGQIDLVNEWVESGFFVWLGSDDA